MCDFYALKCRKQTKQTIMLPIMFTYTERCVNDMRHVENNDEIQSAYARGCGLCQVQWVIIAHLT